MVLITSHADIWFFSNPISVHITLCNFRHDYFELGLTQDVLLRNSMAVDGQGGPF